MYRDEATEDLISKKVMLKGLIKSLEKRKVYLTKLELEMLKNARRNLNSISKEINSRFVQNKLI